jgi:hypothetical protein
MASKRRTGTRSVGVFALSATKTRKSARKPNSVLAKEAEEKEKQKIKLAKQSASATLQKQLDIKDAEERALSAIMERRREEEELKKLLPPPSKSIAATRPAVKENSIERALEEEKERELERELKREERKLKVAEEKRRFEEAQKAKKTRKNWIALEKKYGLEHRSFEKIKEAVFQEELAKGKTESLAKAMAHLQAIGQAEPYMRLLKEGKLQWADILNMENAEDAKKPKMGIKPLSPNTSIVTARPIESLKPTYKSKLVDSKKLIITGLPAETGQGQLDLRKLKRSIYGTMTGKEIFGPERPKELDEVIIIPKLAGAFELMKVGQEVYRVSGTGNKVSASITYPTEALAKEVLAYAKAHPISIKGRIVEVRQS